MYVNISCLNDTNYYFLKCVYRYWQFWFKNMRHYNTSNVFCNIAYMSLWNKNITWSTYVYTVHVNISVLTLGIGIALLFVVILMDCLRSIATDLRRIGPGSVPAFPSMPSSGEGKNWLWKLLFSNSALSLASQFCVVKWHWEEPQVVGSTMSFTVKVYTCVCWLTQILNTQV